MKGASVEHATPGAPHVRDATSVHAVMRTVLLALAPCVAFGLYNTGYQANHALVEEGLAPGTGWRARVLEALGAGRDPGSIADCTLLGALHFLPLLLVALVVGSVCERAFARARGRERAPGLAVTAALFTACLPPTLALWQAALGIAFAVVVGKEIFGGTGRNVFNPAVVGLVFLAFAYPAATRGAGIWVAADGASATTALGAYAAGGPAALAERGVTWVEAFLGRVPGALAWTSKLGCVVGALVLVARRAASWRTMLGVSLGAGVAATLLPGPGPGWHLLLGGLAFGAVFLATDPVTSPMTELGRWTHGILIGAVTVLIRDANPLHVEGVLLAILFGNACAPMLDHVVIRLHVRGRRRRLART